MRARVDDRETAPLSRRYLRVLAAGTSTAGMFALHRYQRQEKKDTPANEVD